MLVDQHTIITCCGSKYNCAYMPLIASQNLATPGKTVSRLSKCYTGSKIECRSSDEQAVFRLALLILSLTPFSPIVCMTEEIAVVFNTQSSTELLPLVLRIGSCCLLLHRSVIAIMSIKVENV